MKSKRLYYLPWILLTVFALIYLCSCSCNYHLKRAREKCGSVSIKDTITVHDTIITKSVSRDTVFNYLQKDTVILKEGKLTMKYFYHDTLVYLQGKCDSDTIYKVIKVPYESTTLNFDLYDWIKKNVLGILIVLVIMSVLIGVFKFFFKH